MCSLSNPRKRLPFVLLLLLHIFPFLLLNLGTVSVYAQSVPPVPDLVEEEELLIAKVRIKGNSVFSSEQLNSRIRTRANRRFLRIPGFTWWLWIYNLGDSGFLGKRVGNALKSIGEPPAYLDNIVLNQDVERLRVLYQQAGFRDADIETVVDTTINQRLEVAFSIDQGAPTFVRSVTYNASSLDLEQGRRLVDASLLNKKETEQEGGLSFIASNQRFSEALLHEERRRILNFLRSEGYAAVTRDSVRAIIVSNNPDSFDINFQINTGPRYRIADIEFNVTGPEDHLSVSKVDTFTQNGADPGVISSAITGDKKLKTDLLLQSLQFRPGEWYDQEKLLATKRRLEATGVFAFTRIDPFWNDTTSSEPGGPPTLPFRIDLETRERHQMQFETFMLQRSGVLATSDSELGMGVGITYQNVNLFGNGESFRLNTTGSVAGDIDSTFFRSTQAEISTSLTVPYLTAPFKRLENVFNLYDARTQLSLSFLTARREELRFLIRGRGTARFRLEMQHNPTLISYADVFDLSLSNPDTLSGFNDEILGQILESIEDPVDSAQVAEDYTEPQINSSLRYTLRSSNVNPLTRDRGYSYEGALEIGGNLLPFILDRYVHTPNQLEGRIPGIPFFGSSGSRNELVYRQYIRLSGDLRQYKPVGQNAVLAWKFITGIAHPTGKADLVPFDRRFYSGGASSVRGWGLRQLGPGRVSSDSTQSILGGDIKLEASIELRSTLLRRVLAAEWILAFFGDAGNVWFGPRNPGNSDGRFRFDTFYREIGVGGGFGLRFAWEYLILRLDLAYRMYDPTRDGPLVDNVFRGPRLHFGIGHAF